LDGDKSPGCHRRYTGGPRMTEELSGKELFGRYLRRETGKFGPKIYWRTPLNESPGGFSPFKRVPKSYRF